MSALQNAVQDRNSRVLELLVAVPGSFSMRDAERALLTASDGGYVDGVAILLRAGVSPDSTDSARGNALSLAAAAGHSEIVRLLAAAGSNVNLRCCGSTALHRAVVNSRESCVTALIEAGANVNALDSAGDTPLLVGAKICRQSLSAIKCLVNAGCNVECKDINGRTALHHASYRAFGAELLLSAGAKPDVKDCDGNAPIHLAAIEGFDTIVRCLVTYNCDADLINENGKQAIHYLAMKGHWRAIDDIARVGGDLNRPDGEGKAPLWYAVTHGRLQAARTLLLANCSPHPTFETECVPLYEALQHRRYIAAQWLLLAGAKLDPLITVINDLNQPAAGAELEDERIIKWLTSWAREPHSLRQLSRTVIRERLRTMCRSAKAVPMLSNLPPSVRDFVALRELEDDVEHWNVIEEDEDED